MPNWKQLMDEINAEGSTFDIIRRKYISNLNTITGRNVIVYYSGWLQKNDLRMQGVTGFEINDNDKNGFMSAIHGMDRTKGLDLVLHTPGGVLSAAESLVDYLRAMFGNDIRAVIPQLAMSAGTMIALSCKEIVMGKHSSLGPIDPQIFGLPAHGIIEEFERAKNEIAGKEDPDPTKSIPPNPGLIPIWQPIIAKYNPTLIGDCEKAITWSEEIVKEWLKTGMFSNDPQPNDKIIRILEELGSHAITKSHDRHISVTKAKEINLIISDLEENDELQDAVLTVHHACMQTLAQTEAIKIIQNQYGTAFIQTIRLGR
jgi:ATP-dependent protease ClpP protease subunit